MKKLILLSSLLIVCAVFSYSEEIERIISLSPSITHNLYALGVDNKVIGITQYCPSGKSKKEIVGSINEPNIEKIASLNPGLVIMTKDGNKKSTYEKLQKLRINCLVLEKDRSFSAICASFLLLSQKLGRQDEGEEIVTRSKKRVAAVQKELMNSGKKTVFWHIGLKPLITAGKNSYFEDINKYTNSVNIFSDEKQSFPRVSKEKVLIKNPDIIIIPTMDGIAREEVLYWKQFNSLNAVKNGRVVTLSEKSIFVPTPENFAGSVEIVSKIVHREPANEPQ